MKWSPEGGIKKKPNPTSHPIPKPHDKPNEPKPKEQKGYVAERDKLEVCPHWAIERLPSCGHEEEGKCRLGYPLKPASKTAYLLSWNFICPKPK